MANTEIELLSSESRDRFEKFDPTKPLVISCNEIEGLEHMTGRFVFRRTTIGDRLKISVRTAKLRENIELDTLHDNIAYVLATFEVVCTEKPANCRFEEFYDLAPLFALHQRYVEWIEFFRLKLQPSQETNSQRS